MVQSFRTRDENPGINVLQLKRVYEEGNSRKYLKEIFEATLQFFVLVIAFRIFVPSDTV